MKKIVKIMKQFVVKNNPEIELNYIFYDSKNKRLIATDTRRLLIIEKDLGEEDLYIDIYNRNDCVEKIVIEDGFIACKDNSFNYPNIDFIDNIVSQKANVKKINNANLTLADIIFNTSSLVEDFKPLIAWNKKYDELNVKTENTHIMYDSENTPIIYKCLIDIAKNKKNKEFTSCTLIIMPMIK